MLSKEQIIENFEVEEILKEFPKSGQKQVFLVKHKILGKVILKIVEGSDKRVEREINIVTENHFNNVPKVIEAKIFSIDDIEGVYIFEEYIDGKNLKDILEENGKIDLNEALELTETILKVIMQMEEKEVVHRDIKPANIIKNKNDEWYLIDFGIARALNLNSLTMTEARVGPHTPGYGAPELFQYSKKDIDSRADIFSLGVVLFEAVTGRHPFINSNDIGIGEIWYNTISIVPQSVVINGDTNMQFMGLIQTFMQKHITRRPRNAIKAMEWYKNVKENL